MFLLRAEIVTTSGSKVLTISAYKRKNNTKVYKICKLKPVFHFTPIVAKRSVFLCSMSTGAELMILTQKKMLRYATIRLKWKTALKKAIFSVQLFTTFRKQILEAGVVVEAGLVVILTRRPRRNRAS